MRSSQINHLNPGLSVMLWVRMFIDGASMSMVDFLDLFSSCLGGSCFLSSLSLALPVGTLHI